MRIGFLSDAHGNHLAMRECLARLQAANVDRIFFLGDAVGYLPGEHEVLDLLREHRIPCQRGNHEAMLLGDVPLPDRRDKVYRLNQARARLSERDREFIASWPMLRTFEHQGKKLLFVHGSPSDHIQGYVYPDTDLAPFNDVPYDAIFMGHTHRPFIKEQNGKLFANVGSCGLPRDDGGYLAYAIYDAGIGSCEIHRVPFDPKQVIDRYGRAAIADEVASVMTRKSEAAVFGTIVGEP